MHAARTGGLRLAEHHADAIDIDGSADHVSGSLLEINVLPGEAQDLGDPPALNEEERYRCAEPVTGSGHEQRADFVGRDGSSSGLGHTRWLHTLRDVGRYEAEILRRPEHCHQGRACVGDGARRQLVEETGLPRPRPVQLSAR